MIQPFVTQASLWLCRYTPVRDTDLFMSMGIELGTLISATHMEVYIYKTILFIVVLSYDFYTPLEKSCAFNSYTTYISKRRVVHSTLISKKLVFLSYLYSISLLISYLYRRVVHSSLYLYLDVNIQIVVL